MPNNEQFQAPPYCDSFCALNKFAEIALPQNGGKSVWDEKFRQVISVDVIRQNLTELGVKPPDLPDWLDPYRGGDRTFDGEDLDAYELAVTGVRIRSKSMLYDVGELPQCWAERDVGIPERPVRNPAELQSWTILALEQLRGGAFGRGRLNQPPDSPHDAVRKSELTVLQNARRVK
jgi:hypothetical protein